MLFLSSTKKFGAITTPATPLVKLLLKTPVPKIQFPPPVNPTTFLHYVEQTDPKIAINSTNIHPIYYYKEMGVGGLKR